jgi:hypothetical protein
MSFLSTYKIPQPRGYSQGTYYVEDTSDTSPEYFDVDFFPMVVGGGRHIIKIKGNGLNMRLDTTVDVEILDASGQRIYCEVNDYYDRFNNYYISFDVYDITAQGVATAYFVGIAKYDLDGNPIPIEYQGEYNVRWIKRFNVLPFERNNADLIFDEPPQVSVAQIVTPAQTPPTSSATTFAYLTASANSLTIIDSNFQGYDRDFASSQDIYDPIVRSIKVDPLSKPMTENTVPTTVRQKSDDITNGYLLNTTTRFGTIISSSNSLFTKELLGANFDFYSKGTTPAILSPDLPSGLTISSSVADQLQSFSATIVEVLNSNQALIDKSLEVVAFDNNAKGRSSMVKHRYRQAGQFTGSFVYVPNSDVYITSSIVSQSYMEFTFSDLNPISGQVYRIKTSTKLGSIVGEYKLLNDQIVRPVEYLTDATYTNPLNYARHESEYLLLGHFYKQDIIDNNWSVYYETPSGFDLVTGTYNNSVLADSIKLQTQSTQSVVLTTTYNQNYNSNQIYTVTCNVTLDPYTELEIYMNSNLLNSYISGVTPFPTAYNRSQNIERDRYSDEYNRFGKYIGKIVNDLPTQKSYGKVVFDFETDSSGLGRPLFRVKPIDYNNITATSWLSDVSIKPQLLNGFTPNIVQYAVPLPQELVNATALSQSIDFKIEYFDYTGKQSEYVTYIDDLQLNLKQTIPTNSCQDQKNYLYYSTTYGNDRQKPPTY